MLVNYTKTPNNLEYAHESVYNREYWYTAAEGHTRNMLVLLEFATALRGNISRGSDMDVSGIGTFNALSCVNVTNEYHPSHFTTQIVQTQDDLKIEEQNGLESVLNPGYMWGHSTLGLIFEVYLSYNYFASPSAILKVTKASTNEPIFTQTLLNGFIDYSRGNILVDMLVYSNNHGYVINCGFTNSIIRIPVQNSYDYSIPQNILLVNSKPMDNLHSKTGTVATPNSTYYVSGGGHSELDIYNRSGGYNMYEIGFNAISSVGDTCNHNISKYSGIYWSDIRTNAFVRGQDMKTYINIGSDQSSTPLCCLL